MARAPESAALTRPACHIRAWNAVSKIQSPFSLIWSSHPNPDDTLHGHWKAKCDVAHKRPFRSLRLQSGHRGPKQVTSFDRRAAAYFLGVQAEKPSNKRAPNDQVGASRRLFISDLVTDPPGNPNW